MMDNNRSFDKSAKVVERRRRVIERLEKQLLTGYKPVIEDGEMKTIPLSDKDRLRIKSEIATLKTRI